MSHRRVVVTGATCVALAIGCAGIAQAQSEYPLPTAKPQGCPQRGVLW